MSSFFAGTPYLAASARITFTVEVHYCCERESVVTSKHLLLFAGHKPRLNPLQLAVSSGLLFLHPFGVKGVGPGLSSHDRSDVLYLQSYILFFHRSDPSVSLSGAHVLGVVLRIKIERRTHYFRNGCVSVWLSAACDHFVALREKLACRSHGFFALFVPLLGIHGASGFGVVSFAASARSSLPTAR